MQPLEIGYRRSSIVLFYKKLMAGLKRLLPEGLYNPLHSTGSWISRKAGRVYYFLLSVFYKIKGDLEDAKKARVISRVISYSLVGPSGLEATYDAAVDVEKRNVEGSFVECGVARGGCAALMALVATEHNKNRKVWLFDSFAGLPHPTNADHNESGGSTGGHLLWLKKGSCLGTYEQVEKFLFSTLSLDRENVHMVKGWFQDTLEEYKITVGPIAILRIDADWYESVKCCLDNFYDQVVRRGYVIVDDYLRVWGAKKALDEFLARRDITVRLVDDGRGGCLFAKPSQNKTSE